jgi:hypothetical protein
MLDDPPQIPDFSQQTIIQVPNFRSVLKSPPAAVPLKPLKDCVLVSALSATEDAFAKHPTSLCTSALGLDTDLVAASAPVTLSVGALANGTESLSVDDVINDDQHPPCASADISSNPTVTGAGMHATNVDEFGLSATQRRLQMQAMTKLQQKLAKSHGEHSKKRSVGSDVAVAKKRAVDQGEMVLAEIDSDASTTLNASDSTPVKTATDSTPIKNNLIVRRAKQRTSLRSQTCLSYDSAEPLLPPSSTSLVNDAQSTCYVIHEESTQAAPNQRLPAGLGLSSCVATQHFPRNSTFITSFSSFYTSPGTTSVFLVSPQALANYVAFLFQKAAVHTT